jgi:hypothetical protein
MAQGMLNLLAGLPRLTGETDLYGLTSHDQLCLLSEDNFQTPWWVPVSADSASHFIVQYLLPEEQAPWREAYVKGEAYSLSSALMLVQIAIERSGGWSKIPPRRTPNTTTRLQFDSGP